MPPFELANSLPIRRAPNKIGFKRFKIAHTIKLDLNPVVFDVKEPKFDGKWPLTVHYDPEDGYESQIIETVLNNRAIFGMDELSDAEVCSQYKPTTTTYKRT